MVAVRGLIVTDAWAPQTNGVVRCLTNLGQELPALGLQVDFLTPGNFWTIPLPSYPEIQLSLASYRSLAHAIEVQAPEFIHIATEGPLGLQARRYCAERRLPFTTSFHTRFPEYIAARMPIPSNWTYAYLRWFHNAAASTLVPTPSLREELEGRGFTKPVTWTRGVDGDVFSPGEKTEFLDLPRPHLLYVGRLAVEKNVGAFLSLSVPGTKIVVGEGPHASELRQRYPTAVFLGLKKGAELSAIYRSADVFVFPSRTDTFGNVIIEALSSGLPVAAFPVCGPKDILTDARCGALDNNLEQAVRRALSLSRDHARAHAERFTWRRCAEIFASVLQPLHSQLPKAA
jgi:glycosyltransferase involved in cell wall biosynthesis